MKQVKTAVVVFHGMGQQVAFESMGAIADTLRKHDALGKAREGCTVTVENAPLQGEDKTEASISRVRMDFPPVEGKGGGTVDVYEAYWAPITAGVATLFDALFFLFSSGVAGIRFSLASVFRRYFWRTRKQFPLPLLNNLAGFLAILLLLTGLVSVGWRLADSMGRSQWMRPLEELSFLMRILHILALPVVAALLARGWKDMGWIRKSAMVLVLALGVAQAPILFDWPWKAAGGGLGVKDAHGLFMARLACIATLISLLLAFVLDRAIGAASAPGGASEMRRLSLPARIIWHQAILAGVAIVLGGCFSALFTWKSGKYVFGRLNSEPLIYAYGALGLLAFLGLRSVLREFVGDLAVYLSSHKASRFADVRARILKEAFKTAYHVYASNYDQVVLVGHSLGSVIAYDTLNGILSHDQIHGKQWNAAAVTKLLLTFGSPLDKTAFVFRSQIEDNGIREGLVAAKQPLLDESHAYRPARWVNVWSPNDIVSGPLDFYDVGKAVLKSASPEGYRFEYAPERGSRPEHNPGGMAPRFIGPGGPAGEHAAKVSPVLSLIDPDADIPFAAHTQFWENDLIYRILAHALMDGLYGKPLEEYLAIDMAPGGPAAPDRREGAASGRESGRDTPEQPGKGPESDGAGRRELSTSVPLDH